ncbi:tyrosine-type recombinase/integrase [Neoroseomonas lacus]|uniref:Integrase n=1 Tax=Neoroseomonas lacus TaxID=287609 RepID=A0A917NRK6_9PROT|nr:integrase arm-type DNA-binding domain-containing protein [Neoroseomonas lacus]GGJ21779.1 integrase [Neoroseomonas lacus]
MPRYAQPLTQRRLETLKPKPKKYRIHDGDNLLLEVRPTGTLAWFARIRVDGKRRDMGLGSYPDVGLAKARELARAAVLAARTGADPIKERNGAVAARAAKAVEVQRTFAIVAEEYVTMAAPGFKHARTAALWRTSLKNYAHPVLGIMQVAEIDREAVLRAIQPVWTSRPATARKVLRRIGSVLRYAAAKGWRPNDNPADAKMLRMLGLPALPAGTSFPSLPHIRMADFMKALVAAEGIAALALRFTILTAVRSGEARGARWSEIAFHGDVPTWTVPPDRMKGKKSVQRSPHRVPLPAGAIEALRLAAQAALHEDVTRDELAEVAVKLGRTLIFPSAKEDTALSDMALSAVIRRMNAAPADAPDTPPTWVDAMGRAVVPHGFRASFRTWVADTRPADGEAAEKALAHEVGTAVTRAYHRSDLFDQRQGLMEAWSRHCAGRAQLKVVA